LLGFAGPRVPAGAIAGGRPDGFRRAEVLFEHGFVDLVVPRDKLRETIQNLLRYMRAAPVDRSAGNGTAPIVRSQAMLDNLLNREPVHG
jgi:acetyl-CoA carboxylase carboxyl transferase subunit beta